MKKIILISIAIMFMWAGNAVAQPACGLWIAGPGTYAQTVDTDFGFRTSNGAAVMQYQGLCGSGGGMPWTFKSSVVPDTCDEHTQLGVRGVAALMGNPGWLEQYPDPLSPAVQQYGDTVRNYYILQQSNRAESTVPSTIGTMRFYDFRTYCPTCPPPPVYTADVVKYDLKIEPMWCPGTYVSTSGAGSNCQVDMTAYVTGNACSMHWELIKKGEVVSGWDPVAGAPIPINTYTTVTYWVQGWGDIPNLTPGPNGFAVQGFMQQMRVEVDQPLRSDIDGDGSVTLIDFGIFAGEFGLSEACACANYWPGQQMP